MANHLKSLDDSTQLINDDRVIKREKVTGFREVLPFQYLTLMLMIR